MEYYNSLLVLWLHAYWHKIVHFLLHISDLLDLDLAIQQTFVYHSSNSTYTPNFVKIWKTFCRWTDVEIGFTRLTRTSRPNICIKAGRNLTSITCVMHCPVVLKVHMWMTLQECMYLHDYGDEAASFSKEEIQQGFVYISDCLFRQIQFLT